MSKKKLTKIDFHSTIQLDHGYVLDSLQPLRLGPPLRNHVPLPMEIWVNTVHQLLVSVH